MQKLHISHNSRPQEENGAPIWWERRGCRGAEGSVSVDGSKVAASKCRPGNRRGEIRQFEVWSADAPSVFSFLSGFTGLDMSSVRLQAADTRNVFQSAPWQSSDVQQFIQSNSVDTEEENTPKEHSVLSLHKWKFSSLCKKTSEIDKYP